MHKGHVTAVDVSAAFRPLVDAAPSVLGLQPDARVARADASDSRRDGSVVSLDVSSLISAVEGAVDEFIADREAAGLPLPDKQQMLDRAVHLMANVNVNKATGINSLEANRRITLHHRDVPPYFGMGTEG